DTTPVGRRCRHGSRTRNRPTVAHRLQSPNVITGGRPCGFGTFPACLTSHTTIVESELAEISFEPSRVMARAVKPPSGAWNRPTSFAVTVSHRRMVISGLAETRVFPSGLKHSAGIAAKALPR